MSDMAELRKITLKNIIGYASVNFLGGGAQLLISAWLMYFYTTMCNLNALEASGIFTAARIIDALGKVLEALAAGASVGVHAHSDWARRLRRLGLPFAPGIRYNEKEQAVARRLALSYSWSRSLLRWERWLQHLSPSGS